MLKTASTIEWIWTIQNTIGLLITLWLLGECIKDRALLIDHGLNKVRLVVANGAVRTQVFRVLTLTIFVLIGLLSMFTVPPIRVPVQRINYVAACGLILGAGLITSSSFLDRRDRQKIYQYYEEEQSEQSEKKEGTQNYSQT